MCVMIKAPLFKSDFSILSFKLETLKSNLLLQEKKPNKQTHTIKHTQTYQNLQLQDQAFKTRIQG